MDSAFSSSSTTCKTKSNISLPAKSDPNSSPPNNTTFVQADPSNFKTIVQKLTGQADQQTPSFSLHYYDGKQPTAPPRRTHPFSLLHERRLQIGRKLENIKLQNGVGGVGSISGSGMERVPTVMVSPVSPLEMMILARGSGSPLTPRSPSEEEERVIAEKGFYLHPSPLNTPRVGGGGGSEPPELLPLFPLSSPRDDDSRTP